MLRLCYLIITKVMIRSGIVATTFFLVWDWLYHDGPLFRKLIYFIPVRIRNALARTEWPAGHQHDQPDHQVIHG